MQLGDGRHVAADGGILEPAVRQLRDVAGDSRDFGRQVAELMVLTVVLEATQVGRVAALGVNCALQTRLDIATH